MAKMAQSPKTKKQVSPLVTVVIIVVVLAIIAVVYMKFGREKAGLDENSAEMKQIRSQMDAVAKTLPGGHWSGGRRGVVGPGARQARGAQTEKGAAPTTPVAP